MPPPPAMLTARPEIGGTFDGLSPTSQQQQARHPVAEEAEEAAEQLKSIVRAVKTDAAVRLARQASMASVAGPQKRRRLVWRGVNVKSAS